jgi:putative restriction endonuclease
VCGFDVRLGGTSIALDAAHIRWVQAAGPDQEANSLALCVLHPKLFDFRVFTISKDGRPLVSDQAHGSSAFDECLLRHHGKDSQQHTAANLSHQWLHLIQQER